MYALARERYHDDRASYHVSAPGDLADVALPALLDQFDARQIVHVTFGSVLTARGADGRPGFDERLIAVLRGHAEVYAAGLVAQDMRHPARFAAVPRAAEATMTAGGNGR